MSRSSCAGWPRSPAQRFGYGRSGIGIRALCTYVAISYVYVLAPGKKQESGYGAFCPDWSVLDDLQWRRKMIGSGCRSPYIRATILDFFMNVRFMVAPLSTLLMAGALSAAESDTISKGIWVRDGYKLTVAEGSIKAPRFLAFGQDGALFVSVPREGAIKICRDNNWRA